MSATRWERAKQIFVAASAALPDARVAILDASCGGDEALRAEVSSLLASHDQASGFLETPAAARAAHEIVAGTDRAGERIGPYRIVREIGQGGMGSVYLAEREDEFRKAVAIKIVRAGFGPDDLSRRFLTERQILANLEHPNIARLLDGGTTAEGWPYLVMELVEGVPITDYCDGERLTIAARLRLFGAVCAAVHYAHQNLVIHRDLKPANILITRDGVPKLLDFGIARLLDPEAAGPALTRTGFHPMTPEYASPEQARGENVTTATDTYSLGVVLYELLCGQRPYSIAAATPREIEQVICETVPPLPSARVETAVAEVGQTRAAAPDKLKRLLAGDLDNVVLMAMRKEADRRYASVAQLADDLRRHLEGLPVIARKETAAYRAWKFARRNRIGVSAAALTALGLVIGIVLASASARQARLQKAIAERRLVESRGFALSLIDDIGTAYKAKTRTAAQSLLTEKTVAYLDALAQQARDDTRLQHDLAVAYRRLGDTQAGSSEPNLGDAAKALKNYEKGLHLFEGLYAKDPDQLTDSRDSVDRRGQLGGAYTSHALALARFDVRKSLESHQRVVPLNEEIVSRAPEWKKAAARFDLAWAYELVGERFGHPYYANVGDTARALEYCQKAFDLRKALDAGAANAYYPAARFEFHLPDSYNLMAGMLWATGRLDQALQYQETGLALYAKAMGDQDETMLRDEFALRHVRWADLLVENGQHREASSHLALARDTLRALVRKDPDNAALLRDLARAYNSAGTALLHAGDLAGALESCRQGAKLGEDALAGAVKDLEVKERLADSYQGTANALSMSGRSREALEHGRKALEIRESLAALDANNARYGYLLALNYRDQGDVLRAGGNPGDATATYRKSLAILDPMSAADPASWLKRRALAEIRKRLAQR